MHALHSSLLKVHIVVAGGWLICLGDGLEEFNGASVGCAVGSPSTSGVIRNYSDRLVNWYHFYFSVYSFTSVSLTPLKSSPYLFHTCSPSPE